MTLEEAKKEIKRRADAYYNGYKGWDKEKPEMRGSLNFLYSANGLDEALEILDEVDTEPVGNPEQLTLKELASELRKIFRFKYLTCDGCDEDRDYSIWLDKPEYTRDGWLIFSAFGDAEPAMMLFESRNLAINLDLSEYADENGNIDYSKCIVEVE